VKKLRGHAIYPILVVALATGARGELLVALRWSDIDLDGPVSRGSKFTFGSEEAKGV
jgi:integrase